MRLYIIPGYGEAADDHWFGWLRAQYAGTAVRAAFVALPDPFHPQAGPWVGTLRREITAPDRATCFVAHSLGCITLLRYLEELPAETRLGGVVLVSGFARHLDRFPALDAFTGAALDTAKIRRLTEGRIALIGSADDPKVPIAETEALARMLNAPLARVEHGGHFQARDGYTEFPELREALQRFRGFP